jgi:hypothetical protein
MTEEDEKNIEEILQEIEFQQKQEEFILELEATEFSEIEEMNEMDEMEEMFEMFKFEEEEVEVEEEEEKLIVRIDHKKASELVEL